MNLNKRELLEACAKATGRTLEWHKDIGYDAARGLVWNPVDLDACCARMEEQMRVSLDWGAGSSPFIIASDHPANIDCHESFADHPSPQAARRWASCRAVAAMKEKQDGNT